ncbi:MAG: hypothetical protein OHK0039_44540 [Bacteroidia bacterium]
MSSNGLDTLVVLPNSLGEDGQFEVRSLLAVSCGGGGSMAGWRFEKMTGLAFNNQGRIGQTYTVAFLYQLDNFQWTTTPYIRMFALRHVRDEGFFIDPVQLRMQSYYPWFYPAFFTATNLSAAGSISTAPIYHFCFTRNASGTLRFFINGVLQGTHNAPVGNFTIQADDDRMVFFQDDLGFYPNEAEPGWVSALSISDFVWSDSAIAAQGNFCPVLLRLPSLTARPHPDGSVWLSWPLVAALPGTTLTLERAARDEAFVSVQQWADSSPWPGSYVDLAPAGTLAYRLAYRDPAGFIHHSAVAAVHVATTRPRIFPQPATDRLDIELPAGP